MNELIEKLAEQAEEYAFNEIQKPQDPTKWKSYSQMYDEKFAELIVRECMGICEDQRAVYTKLCKDATDFRDKNVYAEGEITAHRIRLWIQKNFGVEE